MERGAASSRSASTIVSRQGSSPQRQHLHRQHAGVAIHDQAGEAIGLGVHQAQRIGGVHPRQRGTAIEGSRQAAVPPVRVDLLLIGGEVAQG